MATSGVTCSQPCVEGSTPQIYFWELCRVIFVEISGQNLCFLLVITMQSVTNSRRESRPNVKNYLMLYNAIQAFGWGYLLFTTIVHLASTGSCFGLWRKTELLVEFLQTLAALEIVHAAIGIVPSGVVVTTLQLSSRLFVVWGILWSVTRIYNSITIPLLLLPWSLTETIRYSYYLLNLMGKVPYFLVWMRYTFFIVLYPMGVLGELLSMFVALPYIKGADLYTISLPNFFNFSFNYVYFIMLVASSYIPIFPMLYLHMFAQRKKIISPKKKSE